MFRFGGVDEAKELSFHQVIGACISVMAQSGIKPEQIDTVFLHVDGDKGAALGCTITCFPDEKREMDPITGRLANESYHFTVIRLDDRDVIRVCFENLRWGDENENLPQVDYTVKFNDETGELNYDFNPTGVPDISDINHRELHLRLSWMISYLAGSLMVLTNKKPDEYFKNGGNMNAEGNPSNT
jgi:hypothetical protein